MMADKPLCKIAGCGKPVLYTGLCAAHYRKKVKRGDPLAPDRRLRAPKTCVVAGCQKDAGWRAGGKRGMCGMHWRRWRLNGDPAVVRKAPDGEPARWLKAHRSHVGHECLTWPFGGGAHGYAGALNLDGVLDTAYRHMCRLVHGEPSTPTHQARHSCGRGDQGCVHPGHLSWGTPSENQADRIEHGTHSRGERATTAKLTEADVRQIRALSATVLQKYLALRFGVTRSAIYAVQTGKSWSWLR